MKFDLEILHLILKRMNISMKDLADLSGLKKLQIWYIFSGKSEWPKLSSLEKISKAVDFPLDSFYIGSDSNKKIRIRESVDILKKTLPDGLEGEELEKAIDDLLEDVKKGLLAE